MQVGKKILILIITFTLSITAFTTSTLAWFSIARANYVDNLEMTITNHDDLELSLDGINYYQDLTSDMLYGIIGKDFIFDNVTTFDGKKFEVLSGYDSYTAATPNIQYISFIVYVRTKNLSKSCLYLNNNVSYNYNYSIATTEQIDGTYAISKGVSKVNSVSFDNGGDVPVEIGTKSTYYGADAIRIGINELNVDLDVLQEKDERKELETLIFDPSENKERGFGSLIGAYDYYYKNCNVKLPIPEVNPLTTYQLSTFKNPYFVNENNSKVATYVSGIEYDTVKEKDREYYYAKLQINIWLEGWDADCFDYIKDDKIIVQLQFRSANPA